MSKKLLLLSMPLYFSIVACGSDSDSEPVPTPEQTPQDSITETPVQTPQDTLPETPQETPVQTPQDTIPETPQETPANPIEGNINSGVASMSKGELVLGEMPYEVLGTLEYAFSTGRDYDQGTFVVPESDLCNVLQITTDDFKLAAEKSITVVPLNLDLSEGRHTCSGAYGAWFGAKGTVDWGGSSIAYLEGYAGDILTFSYGAHPSTKASSCTCIMQYRDSRKYVACNVEFQVTIE